MAHGSRGEQSDRSPLTESLKMKFLAFTVLLTSPLIGAVTLAPAPASDHDSAIEITSQGARTEALIYLGVD